MTASATCACSTCTCMPAALSLLSASRGSALLHTRSAIRSSQQVAATKSQRRVRNCAMDSGCASTIVRICTAFRELSLLAWLLFALMEAAPSICRYAGCEDELLDLLLYPGPPASATLSSSSTRRGVVPRRAARAGEIWAKACRDSRAESRTSASLASEKKGATEEEESWLQDCSSCVCIICRCASCSLCSTSTSLSCSACVNCVSRMVSTELSLCVSAPSLSACSTSAGTPQNVMRCPDADRSSLTPISRPPNSEATAAKAAAEPAGLTATGTACELSHTPRGALRLPRGSPAAAALSGTSGSRAVVEAQRREASEQKRG
mmetsp:Transcript_10547/g.23425  ORF Transcript_10547/g.23425 Transcript_10547/m.23425 type:complete len:321 (-) Transcript_10547:299-1261(-)